jgi:hypothetical protein
VLMGAMINMSWEHNRHLTTTTTTTTKQRVPSCNKGRSSRGHQVPPLHTVEDIYLRI